MKKRNIQAFKEEYQEKEKGENFSTKDKRKKNRAEGHYRKRI